MASRAFSFFLFWKIFKHLPIRRGVMHPNAACAWGPWHLAMGHILTAVSVDGDGLEFSLA